MSELQRILEEKVAEIIRIADGRCIHWALFGEYYAPGGGPDCGYRGIDQPNVKLHGVLGIEDCEADGE